MNIRKVTFNALIILSVALLSHAAQAASKNWNCGSGEWENSSCWSPAGLPTTNDEVNISNSQPFDINISLSSYAEANGLSIDSQGQGATNFTVNNSELVTPSLLVGNYGSATVIFENNAFMNVVTGVGSLVVGNKSGSNGRLEVNSGSIVETTWAYIGSSGHGELWLNGGSLKFQSSSELNIGASAGGEGLVTIENGSIDGGTNLNIGLSGTGIYEANGGQSFFHAVYIGKNTGSNGSLVISSGYFYADNINSGSGNSEIVLSGGSLSTTNISNMSLSNTGGTFFGGEPTYGDNTTHIGGDYSQDNLSTLHVWAKNKNSESETPLRIDGTAFIEGHLEVTISAADLSNLSLDDYFVLFIAREIEGTFDTFSLPSIESRFKWIVTQKPTDGLQGIVLSVASAVPIPPAVALFTSGLLMLSGTKRMKTAVKYG